MNMDKLNFWFDYFTKEEKEKIYNNEVKIGDRDTLVRFLDGRGYYERTTSETAYGTSHQFYGKAGTRYSYITSKDGIIDYIAY